MCILPCTVALVSKYFVIVKQKKKVKHHTEKLERGLSEIIDGPLGGAGIGDKSQSRHGPGNVDSSYTCMLLLFPLLFQVHVHVPCSVHNNLPAVFWSVFLQNLLRIILKCLSQN